MNKPSDEIKYRLDIVGDIREYISLKTVGINFRANCPFLHEKTPSFIVSPEKQIWHCFGCGKGGDIISFVMEIEGLSFIEALRALAPKAGVTLTRQDPKIASARNRLLDIADLAGKYYHKLLLESPVAQSARKYLEKRGLTRETITQWQIGYSADSWDDLLNFLTSRGYAEKEIFSAGLSSKKEGISRFYNRFRGRIMFPIRDINGNTVAFSARVMPENEEKEKMGLSTKAMAKVGKYINSPQTMIYDKSKILFGLDGAKLEIKKHDLAIIVEGQMDAITAYQHGFLNVVASSGTALTAEQILLLKRYTNNLSLAFDMDAAGEMAADRGIREAMQADMNIKVVLIPGSKDPDECIKNNPKEWENAISAAKPMMQYFIDITAVGLDFSQIEDKKKFKNKLLPIIAKLGSKIEQDHWIKKISQLSDIHENDLREDLSNINININKNNNSQEQIKKDETALAPLSREEMIAQLILALALKFPRHIEYIINHIQPDQMAGQENQLIYKNLITYYNNIIDNFDRAGAENKKHQIKYEDFKAWLENSLAHKIGFNNEVNNTNKGNNQLSLLDKLVILGDKDYYDYDDSQVKNEIIKMIVSLKKYYLFNQKKEIEKLIARAEKENDSANIKLLMEEFKNLIEELRDIES